MRKYRCKGFNDPKVFIEYSNDTLHQKIKFSIKFFISKCDQICRKLQIWSHLLKKSSMENFVFLCSDMDDIYKIIEEYNPNKKRKILILFDDMIADMLNNKKPNLTVIELFIRRRKLNISFVFIAKFHFAVPKNITVSSTHYFIMKIPNKSSNKLHLIIHHILNFKILRIFTKNVLQSHIHF